MKNEEGLKQVDIDDELDRVSQLPPAERRRDVIDHRAIEYMKKGVGLTLLLRPLNDVLDPDNKMIGSSLMVSDGTWAWSTVDVYYMEKYGIPVPEDFRKYLAERDYAFPDMEEVRRKLEIESA